MITPHPRSILSIAACFGLTIASSADWYKGNTHTHTVLCGHADTSPEAVTQWYHDRGYNFLSLSEHNQFIDPKTVKMPADKREDFILVATEEITGGGHAHTTAFNIDGLVDPRLQQPAGASKTRVIQAHVNGTEAQGGHAISNHPNFNYMNTADDLRPVKGLHLFELYNGHPKVNNFGNHEHPSVEAIWDDLLTSGMLIYGVSSDDAHTFQKFSPQHSNPGRGWVMVQASELTPDAISDALYHGSFYATSGVMLKKAEASRKRISLQVDERVTEQELSSPFIMGHAVDKEELGYRIQFIGPNGKILKEKRGKRATFAVDDAHDYVRAKVIYTRESENGYERFYAWMQPVFTDGRTHYHAK